MEFGSKNKAPTLCTPTCIPGAHAAFYPPYLAPLSREISKETTTNATTSEGFQEYDTEHPGEETITDEQTQTKQKSTPTQRTAMRKRRKKEFQIDKNKERREITRKTHVTENKTIYQVAPESRRVRRPEK